MLALLSRKEEGLGITGKTRKKHVHGERGGPEASQAGSRGESRGGAEGIQRSRKQPRLHQREPESRVAVQWGSSEAVVPELSLSEPARDGRVPSAVREGVVTSSFTSRRINLWFVCWVAVLL